MKVYTIMKQNAESVYCALYITHINTRVILVTILNVLREARTQSHTPTHAPHTHTHTLIYIHSRTYIYICM